MSAKLPRRFWVESAIAAVCGVSAFAIVLVSLWPQWIELIVGADPDNGSGTLEWAIASSLLVVAVLLSVAARREWKTSITQTTPSWTPNGLGK